MSATSSSIRSIVTPLPESIKAQLAAYTQEAGTVQASIPSPSPPKPSKLPLPRRSSCLQTPLLRQTAPARSPSSPPSSLPACAYNYQHYIPAPPPSVVRWTRRQLYQQIVSPAPPVFLSCNLANPEHLASILAHGCGAHVMQMIADNMTPAVLCRERDRGRACLTGDEKGSAEDSVGDGGAHVKGVLVGGLREEVLPLLEGVMRRRFGEGYERVVREVDVGVEEGETVVVAAYVYRTCPI